MTGGTLARPPLFCSIQQATMEKAAVAAVHPDLRRAAYHAALQVLGPADDFRLTED